MFTVPTILTMLTRHDAVDRYDHSSLRYVIYAGAPMYRADQVHALRKLGKVLVQYFGLGEVTGNITVLPAASAQRGRRRDAGRKLRVSSHRHGRRDPERCRCTDLPPGTTGEICVRGPGVFAGYHNNPEATAKAFAHGWFHTGDLGHMDARGFVSITGRASDMYISGGSNVYPREIEEALLLHPAVAEACVVGMPHEKWGESGVAVLVLEPGASATAAELLAHLDGKLAKYKWPNNFAFWPELPKSGYGKVVKKRRQAPAAGGFVMASSSERTSGRSIQPGSPTTISMSTTTPKAARARRNCANGSRRVSPSAWADGTTCRSDRIPPRCIRSHFPVEVFPTLVPFVMMNRMGLTVLLHPESGRPRDDHTLNATWMGEVLPLNTAILPETDRHA